MILYLITFAVAFLLLLISGVNWLISSKNDRRTHKFVFYVSLIMMIASGYLIWSQLQS